MTRRQTHYYPNNVVRFLATFTNSGGAPVNPSSISLILNALGTNIIIDTTSIANPSTGVYHHDYEVNSTTELFYEWRSFGTHISRRYGAVQIDELAT